MSKGDRAGKYFCEGYNCAQAVVLAFAEEIGIDEKTLAKLSSSFGGGMGRLREVCGSVSGMFMVLGLLRGYDSPADVDAKAAQYKIIQNLANEFQALHGSIICREILKKPTGADHYMPAERTVDYYQSRPCELCVRDAANILEKFLKN